MSLTFRRTLQLLGCIVSVAIVSACGALGSPSAIPGSNDDSPQTSSRTFHFTHAIQRFKVPTGVTQITITAYGAMGGGYSNPSDGNPGGLGAKVKATIPVTPGQVLVVNVGGKGAQNKDSAGGQGYNGGGTAGDSAFGGGGSSDVRTAQGWLADRLVIAAGGGGSGYSGEASSCGGSSCSSSGSTELLYGGIGGIGGATTGGGGGTGADGGGGGTGASQTNGGAGGAGAGGTFVSFSSYRSCAAVDGSNGKLYNGGAGASDSCGPAGGGGGGGYYGGGGGGGGGYDNYVATGSINYESGGGGGGGGGTSFVEKSGTDIHKTSGGAPPGNGEITIAWR
jgi:hypothetical protein